jgi:SAM-dependent methyltransferase
MDAIDRLLLAEEGRRAPFRGRGVMFGESPEAATDREVIARELGLEAVAGQDTVGDLEVRDGSVDSAGLYDAVFDLGESPRRFHMPHVMANLCRLVRPGGRIVHVVPSCNHMDKVYYMMSPTYYADFYAANGFDLDVLRVVRCPPNGPIDVLAYAPGRLAPISHGGLDAAPYRIVCVARRTERSTWDAVPQQGSYVAAWGASAGETRPAEPSSRSSLLRALWNRVRDIRPLYRLVYAVRTPAKRRSAIAASLPRLARHELGGN